MACLKIYLFASLFFPLSFSLSYADDLWCIEDRAHPPCGGAEGRCTINSDGSWGGFVANTATVPSVVSDNSIRNVPYIAPYAQVCHEAQVLGNARVEDHARVTGYAKVYGSARISGNAKISGFTRIFDRAQVSGFAKVYDYADVVQDAQILDRAKVFGNAVISRNAQISGNASVTGNAWVADNARVSESAHVFGKTHIFGNAEISGNAQIYDKARISENAHVYGRARVYGYAQVFGRAQVYDDARVFHKAVIYNDIHIFGTTEIYMNSRFIQGLINNGSSIRNPALVPILQLIDLPPGPGDSLVLPRERPPAEFEQSYAGSEAEVYYSYLNQRHQFGTDFHRVVDVLGESVDANSYDYDGVDAFDAGYEIRNEHLASVLSHALRREIKRGDVIRQSEILSHESAANAIASSSGENYFLNRYAFPSPSSGAFPLREEASQYLEFLRRTIFDKLTALNQSAENQVFEIPYRDAERRRSAGEPENYSINYYHNPHCPSNGGIYIHNRSHPVYRHTGALFFKIMEAIKLNDEKNFLAHMVNLATAFHPSRIEARNGLIEVFTYLYVAKRFPNRMIRQRYFHFTLNCGGIY